MSIEKIHNMLAAAPNVSQWWTTNKARCVRAFQRWENVLHGCANTTFGFLLLGMGLDAAAILGFAVPSPIINAAYLMCFGFGCAFCGTLWWSLWSNKRPFKQQSDAFGFDLDNGFPVSEKIHREVVTRLKEIDVDVEKILALRDLDLPNGWWHTMNFLVQSHTEEHPKLKLDEVYVELERTALPSHPSKVLRL